MPEAVKLATTAYRVEMDAFGTFLRDCCVVGQTKEVPAADLHCAVDAYVRGAGERPLGAKALAKALRGRGFKSRLLHGCVIWQGLCLTQGATVETRLAVQTSRGEAR